MEIRFENLSYLNLQNISLSLNAQHITAIIGDDSKKDFINLFCFNNEYNGAIYIDNKLVDDQDYSKDIAVINNTFNFQCNTIIEEIKDQVKKYSNKYIKKSLDALLIVNLIDKKEKPISDLSTGEKILLNIAIALAKNPKVIIFDDIFYYLDYNNRKLLINLMTMMNKRYHKSIILLTNNLDYIYQISKRYIVIKNGKILIEGDKELFYNNYELLQTNTIDFPQIVKFIQMVYLRKQIALYHRDDIKDLMKDIYRSVI